MDIFQRRKQDTLKKQDRSSKGDIDKKILKLCEKINKNENYYTTSSCSGRIVLMVEQEKKAEGLFLKVWHDEVSFGELKNSLKKIREKNVKFKQEPCILHVACRDLKSVIKLLDKAKKAGWKRSGITGVGKNRLVLELSSTEKIEFTIIHGKRLIVDDNFLKIITKKSNENLKRNWKKIENLEKLSEL
jgi:tRNA wybutosine-synthesizing protein 3